MNQIPLVDVQMQSFGKICSDGSCLPCSGDGICDEDENCSCSDCDGEQDGCGDGRVCDPRGAPMCITCDYDDVCDDLEDCSCSDCNGEQAAFKRITHTVQIT